MRMFSHGVAAALAVALPVCCLARPASADTVVLKNGDTLNGKIGQITAGGLKFTSDAFGEVTIPLDKMTSYKIDTPAVVQFKSAPPVTASVASSQPSQVKLNDEPVPFETLKIINPPPQSWNGAILANFALARGNTNKFTVGVDANAALRRDDYLRSDRTTLLAQYNFGQSGGGPGSTDGDNKVTDTDNFTIFAKYDRFWTEKLYGYVSNKLEHDRIADLYFRETPSVGLGYQWIETPTTNFFTEAGVGYVFENYDSGGNNDYVSVRLAYHLEHTFNDRVSGFHNLEYLPAFEDPGDYNLNTDIGLKIKLTDNFLAQLKFEYKRDSTPAEDALKNDLLYLVGLGWTF
jgi:putative salt-induced outer membrane protein YdiY